MGSGWVSLALKLKTENEWATETLKYRALEKLTPSGKVPMG